LLFRQPHVVAVVLQRLTTDEAAQHYGLLLTLIIAHLNKEAAARIGQVVEVNAALILPALS
jgi:hypothetical protein